MTPNLTYSPNPDFSGTDSFTFQVNDGKSDSNIATIHFTVTPAAAVPAFTVAVGADAGPRFRTYDQYGGIVMDKFAFAPQFTGGIRVAMCDVDGDGISDVVTVPGSAGGPEVKVFSGVTHEVIRNYFAYSPSLATGLWVACGDVNGDGKGDIITAPAKGGAPHVRVFSGTVGNQLITEFFAYDATDTNGVTVNVAKLAPNQSLSIVTVPEINSITTKAFDGFNGQLRAVPWGPTVANPLCPYKVYASGDGCDPADQQPSGAHYPLLFLTNGLYAGGLRMTTADVDGDGYDDLIYTTARTPHSYTPTGGPTFGPIHDFVMVLRGTDLALIYLNDRADTTLLYFDQTCSHHPDFNGACYTSIMDQVPDFLYNVRIAPPTMFGMIPAAFRVKTTGSNSYVYGSRKEEYYIPTGPEAVRGTGVFTVLTSSNVSAQGSQYLGVSYYLYGGSGFSNYYYNAGVPEIIKSTAPHFHAFDGYHGRIEVAGYIKR